MINGNVLDAYRKDLESTIKELNKKYNITSDIGSMRYNSSEFSFKMTNKVIPVGGLEELKHKEWNANCHALGLEPNMIGKTLQRDGKQFLIEGVNMRKYKRPIIIKGIHDNKSYCCDASYVRQFLQE